VEYLEVRFRSFKGLGYKHKSDSDRQRYRSLTGNSPADHGPPADPGISLTAMQRGLKSTRRICLAVIERS